MIESSRKLLSLFLSVLMVFSLLPVTALGVSETTVYCQAPDSWSACKLYWWGSSGTYPAWPGVDMSLTEDGIWSGTVPSDASGLIFHNDTGRQSSDLTVPTDDLAMYVFANRYWTTYGRVDVFTEYYVAGSAELCGEDWIAGVAANKLSDPDNDGVYTITYTGVAAGTYEFKVTGYNWEESWGKDGGAENYLLTVDHDNSAVEISFDAATKLISVSVRQSTETTDPTEPVVPEIPGDATLDGELSIVDVARIYAHVRETNLLTHPLALKAADITGDGAINISDVAKTYAYIRGTDPVAVVDAAYQLAQNEQLSDPATLTGTVASILEPYNEKYKCITLVVQVTGRENKPIICCRLTGDHTANITEGDTVIVCGTLRNFYGSVEFAEGCTLEKWVDVPSAEEAQGNVVEAAYALPENTSMDHAETLTGKVISIEQAYSAALPYISVTIVVPGKEDRPISCYRLVGESIAQVSKDDTITVTGTLRNFYGTVEFDAGCQLESVISNGEPVIVPETDPQKIVDAAYALSKDTQMDYDVTLTAKVTSIKTAYDPAFQNISVVVQVAGRETMPIVCYRMKGTNVERVAVGDTITVAGRLKNYNGTVEFDAGCTLVSHISAGGTAIKAETDPAKIMAAAGQLAENEELPYEVTLSGKVISVDEVYSETYQNITVTIAVSGADNQTLKCYRLKGDGVNEIAVGDTITVQGTIKNYYGELELVNGTLIGRVSGAGIPVIETDYVKIVDAAYNLEVGDSLPYTATLSGRIVELQTPYDGWYKHMTVVMAVVGREEKPIVCYRIKGDLVSNDLCVGDTITVTGKLHNYNGTIEFNTGCTLDSRTPGSVIKPEDPEQIVDAAFALGENQSLPYIATLTGVVTKITEPYTDQYQNIILVMNVESSNGTKEITCYRMKGNNAAYIAIGNTITVTGTVKNYTKTDDETGITTSVVQFNSGCILDSLKR